MLLNFEKASAVLKMMESSPRSTAAEISALRSQLDDPKNFCEANTDKSQIEVPDWAAKSQPSTEAIRARASGQTGFDRGPLTKRDAVGRRIPQVNPPELNAPPKSVYDSRAPIPVRRSSDGVGTLEAPTAPPEAGGPRPTLDKPKAEPSWIKVTRHPAGPNEAGPGETFLAEHQRLQAATVEGGAGSPRAPLSVTVTKLEGQSVSLSLKRIAGLRPEAPFTASYELNLGNPKHKALHEYLISPKFQAEVLALLEAPWPLSGTMAEMRRPSMAEIVTSLTNPWTSR